MRKKIQIVYFLGHFLIERKKILYYKEKKNTLLHKKNIPIL